MSALNSTLFRGTRARLPRVSENHALATIRTLVATALVAATSLLGSVVNLFQLTWTRLRLLSREEDGYTTQVVVMTAILAALAIAAGAIIYLKVIDKANSINLNGNTGQG